MSAEKLEESERRKSEKTIRIVKTISVEDESLEHFTITIECLYNGHKLEYVPGSVKDASKDEKPDLVSK